MISTSKNADWGLDDEGEPLWAWGLIDPEFDAAEYQTAENVEDVFADPAPPEPNIVGNSRDNFDTITPCEIKYASKLRLISETDMDNYRRVLKAQMRV